VAAPVGDIVDPDAFEAVEGVAPLAGVGHDAGGDRADGPPGMRIGSTTAVLDMWVTSQAT